MRLYGKRPVLERLRAAPRTIQRLVIQQETDASEVVRAAKEAGRPFDSISRPEFARLAGEVHAQGVLAEVLPFEYAPFKTLLRRQPPLTLFFLDRLTDPQNLGAILRMAACLGGLAVILPKHDSVEVTEATLRVACGGENYVPVAQVTNLARAAEQAKEAGYWIAGAAVTGGVSLPTADWPTPLAVVLGSEGEGIRPGLQKHLELTLTLPMPGAPLSFNVAAAAALVAYEITRRRLTGVVQ